jgi:hypothetical protein
MAASLLNGIAWTKADYENLTEMERNSLKLAT